LLLSLVFLYSYLQQKSQPALTKLPKQIVWAWQRPEDLRFLPANIGVAYVASSVTLQNNHVDIQARQHQLLVNPSASIMPVVHVDASWRNPPSLSHDQAQAIVDELTHAAAFSNANVVQLDFEVRRSQQAFLAKVISAARQKLPKTTALSVTALASWCTGDYWIGALDADEIVPMAFRMAAGDAAIRQQLANQGHFKHANCQAAIGTAIDEPAIALDTHSLRHYYFSPKPWTAQLWQQQN
jgi:hypothetical protein